MNLKAIEYNELTLRNIKAELALIELEYKKIVCTKCKGSGKLVSQFVTVENVDCPACDGVGHKWD